MREIQHLRLQVEDSPLIVDLGRRKVERVARPEAEREPIRNLPVIYEEKLRDVGTLLQQLLLNVDRERIHIAQ